MIRNTFFAVFSMLVLAAASQAEIMISSTSEPTPGLAGFTTFQLTATSSTDPIVAVDFIGTGSQDPSSGYGFFGAMNQLNPANLGTIFTDNNGVIVALGGNPAQDSQFKVAASTVTVPDPANNTREGANILQAIWAWGAPQGLSIPLAQLVIPDAAASKVDFRGVISRQGGGDPYGTIVEGCVGLCGDPNPNTAPSVIALAPINVAWPNVVTNLQLTGTDAETAANLLQWSALVPGAGNPTLVNAPTLGANGLFNWDPTGSQGGSYTWNATVTDDGNPALSGSGLALTINYTVPEPATLSLLGLALVGFVGLRKRS